MAKQSGLSEKRQTAQGLFVRNGLQGQEIAKLIGVSQKTVSKWKAEDNWEKQKIAFTTTKPKELARLYAQLGNLNDAIEARDQGFRFPLPGEADSQSKLASSIKKLEDETGLSNTVNAFIAFIDWLRKHDLAKSKEFAELADQYIKHIAR